MAVSWASAPVAKRRNEVGHGIDRDIELGEIAADDVKLVQRRSSRSTPIGCFRSRFSVL